MGYGDFFDYKPKYWRITYKMDGHNCHSLTSPGNTIKVINRDTGEQMFNVIECDPTEGWLIRQVVDANGKPQLDATGFMIMTEKVHGPFEIRVYPDAKESGRD
jgi:hypothetical protein